jgi:hypothetical protein
LEYPFVFSRTDRRQPFARPFNGNLAFLTTSELVIDKTPRTVCTSAAGYSALQPVSAGSRAAMAVRAPCATRLPALRDHLSGQSSGGRQ